MKILNMYIPIFAFAILTNCSNAKDQKQSDSDLSDNINSRTDTLINSDQQNFLQVLDTIGPSNQHEIRSYTDILDLFEKLNYTPEAWQAGIREVPRVYLPIIGDRWRSTTANEITVELKKRLFFRGLAPLILRSNELIMKDRDRLEKIRSLFQDGGSLTDRDKIWVIKLAGLYKINNDNDQVTASALDELWKRVDIIPASLALSQGAEESGWGTSRFAAAGNAIYGQWSWGKNAITPEQQRKELGNYGIAAFGSLQESVSGYMLNLNTHNAYADLRNKRAELRQKGQKISGSVLAEQLTKYSERGEEYVKTLKSMMEYNRLSPADDAYLTNDPPIFLIPVAD